MTEYVTKVCGVTHCVVGVHEFEVGNGGGATQGVGGVRVAVEKRSCRIGSPEERFIDFLARQHR